MSRREAWLSAIAVGAFAFVVAAVAAVGLRFPVPEDTAYYAGVARNLVEGRGLVSDALWSYQTPPLTVPRAAFELWLPLPSLLEAVPMAVIGAGNWFRAAQLTSTVLGALVAVLAWRLGADVAAELRLPPGRARTLAVGSGIVAGLVPALVVFGANPDSTTPFAVLSLAACLLMSQLVKTPPRRLADARLVALGALLGLAALTRSEAIWLGLTWLLVAGLWLPGRPTHRLGLAVVPAAVAGAIFVPWAVRDWLVFGSPLPGQALTNALYVTPLDIYAYKDPPTLARYLAQGPAALLQVRLGAVAHDLFAVLMLPAIPTGPVGLVALAWTARLRALRPLLVFGVATFLAAGLVFPVSTTWGTFLHSAGAIHVLLVVSCLVALDAVIVRIGHLRGWTRPVAWLGPAIAGVVAVPLVAVAMTALDGQAADVERRYAALPAALARAGVPLDPATPVVSDHPIWLAEATRNPAIALPDESPADVLALAHTFRARLIVVQADDDRGWPDVLAGSTAAACYRTVALTDTSATGAADAAPLARTRVFAVVCP